ncbi:MAG: tol-pal system protein YbgF [Candidatus Latescibacteria bacterium]|nr:tol-pal system protein YbgF [Candidatus Latescibacterota bacterium]
MRLSPLLLGLACLSGAGCAQQVSLKRMHLDNQELSRKVVALDSLLRAREAEDERRWIEESTDGDELKKQVQQVQARLDDVARRLADLAKDLEAVRLSSGSKGRPAAGRPAAAAPADAGKDPQPLLLADPQELYNLAFKDMEAGNYALAITEFSQVLDNFPQSEVADNACYWLGECYYAQKDFPKAAEVFQRLVKDYSKGDKVPGALLKLGYALAEQKEQAKAAASLREVVEKYPDSSEAKLAKEKLKALAPPAKKPAGKRR